VDFMCAWRALRLLYFLSPTELQFNQDTLENKRSLTQTAEASTTDRLPKKTSPTPHPSASSDVCHITVLGQYPKAVHKSSPRLPGSLLAHGGGLLALSRLLGRSKRWAR
jgi:hypothetical protein